MGRGGCSGGGFSGGGGSRGGFSGSGRSASNFTGQFTHAYYVARARRLYHVPVAFNFFACPSYKRYSSATSKTIGLIVGLIILAIIATICAVTYVGAVNSDYKVVSGTCVSNDYHRDYKEPYDYKQYYFSTYRYTVSGTTYQTESRVGWEKPEDIGKTVEICYNIDDPADILEKEGADNLDVKYNDGKKTKLIIAIALYAVAAILLISAIVNSVKSKKIRSDLDNEVQAQMQGGNSADRLAPLTSNAAADSSDEVFSEFKSNTPKTKSFRRCEYCGSRITDDMDKCPNCGASTHGLN